jgi:hypothetical protein
MKMRIMVTGLIRAISATFVCVGVAQSQDSRLAPVGRVPLHQHRSCRVEPSTFGALQAVDTIVTNNAVVDLDTATVTPTPLVEPCDSSSDGYYIAKMDLLDWTPTVAPNFKSVSTGYKPLDSSTGTLGGIPAGGLNEGRHRASSLRRERVSSNAQTRASHADGVVCAPS